MDGVLFNQVVNFLSSSRLFGQYNINFIKKIASHLDVIYLQGGETLIKQNDVDNNLYIVFSGRLKATSVKEMAEVQVGQIGYGEIVGEVSLILNEPRTKTVVAIRDSILLKLSKENYLLLGKEYSPLIIDINRFCIKRLLSNKISDRSKFSTIAFVPAGTNPGISEFVSQIANILESSGSTLYLNEDRFNQLYGKKMSQATFESEHNPQIISWLHDQEIKYRYIIYETNLSLTQWTLRCLRQVDRIVLIAYAEENHELNEIESTLKLSNINIQRELVILHKSSTQPSNTFDWLKPRTINDHYHVQINSAKDYAAFIRFLTGHTLGMVLGGGGLRAAAYIGLFRALDELKIKVDVVGGNSAGAFLGALYAKGVDHNEMKNVILRSLQKNFHYNYTYPMLSLFTGKYITDYLHESLGDDKIEDLWRKFFCISYNLSVKTVHVHLLGPLYEAVRTSSALPGILPPVINEKGEMFVDGGIYNNLPVDVMRDRIGDGKILAINLVSYDIPKFDKINYAVSGWELLFEKLFVPKEKRKKIPSISDVIISSMVSASAQREKQSEKMADHLINIDVGDFKLFQTKGLDELVYTSYIFCMKELERIFNL